MGDHTGIEWTDATWNPVRGCTRVSEGCRHCYAEVVAARFSGPGQPYEGLAKRVGGDARWTGAVRMVPEHLADPLRWKRPRRIFVNSMSDLFHEGLGFEQIAAVFGVMASSPRHTFQVLTKRPQRALEFFDWAAAWTNGTLQGAWMACHFAACELCQEYCPAPGADFIWPLPNVWPGVSVEDQPTADERIPLLLQCPAAVRFVSYEPALAAVDFGRFAPFCWEPIHTAARQHLREVYGDQFPAGSLNEKFSRQRIGWLIVGGESGPGARPFDVEWARSTVRRCREAGVACFVKQLGAAPFRHLRVAGGGLGTTAAAMRLRDRKGGDWSEWPEDLRVREFPEAQA